MKAKCNKGHYPGYRWESNKAVPLHHEGIKSPVFLGLAERLMQLLSTLIKTVIKNSN